jgi:hypothetical protein
MAEGTNFDAQVLQKIFADMSTLIMVVGVHVKHTNMKVATEGFCPSIATVVPSNSTSATHYPGTIRAQQQFKHITGNTRHPEESITDLTNVMQLLWLRPGQR